MTDPDDTQLSAEEETPPVAQTARKKWLVPVGLAAALALLVAIIVAVNASTKDRDSEAADGVTAPGQDSQTFSIKNGVVGDTDNANRSGQSCKFYDGWLRAGDPVIVRGADGTILGKSELVFESLSENPPGLSNVCTFGFTMQGVKAGEPAYELTVGNLAPLIQTQHELQSYYYYHLRNAISVLAGETDELIGRR